MRAARDPAAAAAVAAVAAAASAAAAAGALAAARTRAPAPHVDAALLQAHEFPEAAVAREAAVRGSPPASADI